MEQEVVVHAGHVERVTVPLPESRKVRANNEGGWVVGGGPLVGVSDQYGMGGVSAFGGLYRTLSTTLELRLNGELGLVYVEDGWGPELSLVPMLRVKWSALYAMQFGLQLGAATTFDWEYAVGGHVGVKGAFGARVSLASLSFGARREIELTLWHSLLYCRRPKRRTSKPVCRSDMFFCPEISAQRPCSERVWALGRWLGLGAVRP